MKKLLLLFSVFCAVCLNAASQDVITRRDGQDVRAKIVGITGDAVKYKRENLPDGPLFSMPKSEILMVTYGDGHREMFSDCGFEPVPGLVPGMKYDELREYYDYRDYSAFSGYEQYPPVIMGLCSFVIPGLGQMIAGEVGRGFRYLGGYLGCYAVLGGSLLAILFNPAQGTMMALASCAALVAVDVCAIVDAVRVAKVKNMYCSDLERMSVSLDLTPYVDVANTGFAMAQPVAGLSLRLSF